MDNSHPLYKSNRLFLYLTDRCNYKCRHCYISKKHPSIDMSFDMVLNILKWFKGKKPKLILLGGEPTLYPYLEQVTSSAKSMGFRYIKIESNGGDSYGEFACKTELYGINQVAFSIDGHNEAAYSLTRGKGYFSKLIENISITKNLGVRFYGILSISKLNAIFTSNIIKFCKSIGCERVTIHYITIRGDSINKIELSPEEWDLCKKTITKTAIEEDILVRYEDGFILNTEISSIDVMNQCATNFNENIMVMPSGDTFMCTMFLDHPHLSAYFWNGETFQQKKAITEKDICSNADIIGCPGYRYTRNSINLNNYVPICAFRKKMV